ncbi:MAG: zinc ribbon domain-containing protein [Anaerolineaceae bacterium]|nr:zinc ribbon domain-containing protein [Anaerolineaceae bacterium]
MANLHPSAQSDPPHHTQEPGSTSEVLCPRCGAWSPANSNFCNTCGAALGGLSGRPGKARSRAWILLGLVGLLVIFAIACGATLWNITSPHTPPEIVPGGGETNLADPTAAATGQASLEPPGVANPYAPGLDDEIYVNVILSFITDCASQGVLSRSSEQNQVLAHSDWKFLLDSPHVYPHSLSEADVRNGFVYLAQLQLDLVYDNHSDRGWRQGKTGVETYGINQDGKIYLYNDISVYHKNFSESVFTCERIGLSNVEE